MSEFLSNLWSGFIYAGIPCCLILTALAYYKNRLEYGVKFALISLPLGALLGWIGCAPLAGYVFYQLFKSEFSAMALRPSRYNANYTQELMELAKLKEAGVITDQEFEMKKQEILGRKVA